jgi:CDP-diacylglycerol--glycerol-3-phosphate 3-phosphatidyltransferase
MHRAIPWLMIIFRASLAPLLVAAALWLPAPQPWLGSMIAAGFISDVYDGVLARRWGTDTTALRLCDSAVDTFFYLGVLAAVIIRHRPVLLERIWLLVAVLLLEALRLAFDWIKFRRMASYHSYAAKLWGVLLAIATIALLCFDRAYWLLTVALVWGILCDLEGLMMSALLPVWTRDVKTLGRAIELRRQILSRIAV